MNEEIKAYQTKKHIKTIWQVWAEGGTVEFREGCGEWREEDPDFDSCLSPYEHPNRWRVKSGKSNAIKIPGFYPLVPVIFYDGEEKIWVGYLEDQSEEESKEIYGYFYDLDRDGLLIQLGSQSEFLRIKNAEKRRDKKIIYITFAYRHGFLNQYNFLVCATHDKNKAIKAAKEHEIDRGGKYRHRVYEATEDIMYDAERCDVVWSSMMDRF